MAKKKKQTVDLKLVLKGVALLLSIGALLFALLNCVKYGIKDTELYLGEFTGFEVIFGLKEEILTKEVVITSFSFMNLLAFILPLAGGILLLFKNKILNFVSIACFAVGAVLLFLVPSFAVIAGFSAKLHVTYLGIGAILAAICSILGALVACYVTLTK